MSQQPDWPPSRNFSLVLCHVFTCPEGSQRILFSSPEQVFSKHTDFP